MEARGEKTTYAWRTSGRQESGEARENRFRLEQAAPRPAGDKDSQPRIGQGEHFRAAVLRTSRKATAVTVTIRPKLASMALAGHRKKVCLR